MKINSEDFTVADIYQFMTGEQRKAYQPMPMWSVLMDKLKSHAEFIKSIDYDFPIIERCIITKSPFEDNENAVDFIIFIDSKRFLDLKKDTFALPEKPFFTGAAKVLLDGWHQFKDRDDRRNKFIDRVILIDNGVVCPEQSIGEQRACFELFKYYYGEPLSVDLSIQSRSFHQNISQKYFFMEEFMDYLSSSDVNVSDAVLGYVSCLIPVYIMDISYRNNIENIFYNNIGEVMRRIEVETICTDSDSDSYNFTKVDEEE